MNVHYGRGRFLAGAALAVVLVFCGAAEPNGGHFLAAKEEAEAGLLYFGEVKDEDGKHIGGATITLEMKDRRVTYVTTSDDEGHYKTLDLGKNTDPAKLEIVCSKDGYRQIAPAKRAVPGKRGAVEVNFTLERE